MSHHPTAGRASTPDARPGAVEGGALDVEAARRLVIDTSQACDQAARDLEGLRARRDAALRAAFELGLTKKDLAGLSGLTQPGVAQRLAAVGIPVVTHEERAEARNQQRKSH